MEGDLSRLLSDKRASIVLDSTVLARWNGHRRPQTRHGTAELGLVSGRVVARISADVGIAPRLDFPPKLADAAAIALNARAGVPTCPVSIHQCRAKRSLDVTVAVLLLLMLVPVLFFVGIFVLLDRRGPVLFLQRRCGLGGTVFRIWKFRTMTVCDDSDKVAQTRKGDGRITRFGAFLRRTSIDELPQLFNVLMGDMSLVGPRPHATSHDLVFARAVPDYTVRHQVRPGITGLAQVRGYRGAIHNRGQLADRVASDIEYIRSWSLMSDLRILVASVGVVFRSDGT